jgi:hypothetical protein
LLGLGVCRERARPTRPREISWPPARASSWPPYLGGGRPQRFSTASCGASRRSGRPLHLSRRTTCRRRPFTPSTSALCEYAKIGVRNVRVHRYEVPVVEQVRDLRRERQLGLLGKIERFGSCTRSFQMAARLARQPVRFSGVLSTAAGHAGFLSTFMTRAGIDRCRQSLSEKPLGGDCIPSDPPPNAAGIHLDSAFRQHLGDVFVGQRISQVPAHG